MSSFMVLKEVRFLHSILSCVCVLAHAFIGDICTVMLDFLRFISTQV